LIAYHAKKLYEYEGCSPLLLNHMKYTHVNGTESLIHVQYEIEKEREMELTVMMGLKWHIM
jgi:hypothetical protein